MRAWFKKDYFELPRGVRRKIDFEVVERFVHWLSAASSSDFNHFADFLGGDAIHNFELSLAAAEIAAHLTHLQGGGLDLILFGIVFVQHVVLNNLKLLLSCKDRRRCRDP